MSCDCDAERVAIYDNLGYIIGLKCKQCGEKQ